jgi:hypothetical protein
MPFVVSVTVTLLNATVIGGLHSGWNVAVKSIEKRALPFWTGTFSAVEKLCLLPGLRVIAAGVNALRRGAHHDGDLVLVAEPSFLAVYRQGVAAGRHAA